MMHCNRGRWVQRVTIPISKHFYFPLRFITISSKRFSREKYKYVSIMSDLISCWEWASWNIRKLRVAHAPRMLGTFSPPLRASEPGIHDDTCMTHVPWCMPESLTSGFLWRCWRGNHYRQSRPMHNQQFYVSGKRPIGRSARLNRVFCSTKMMQTYHVCI